MNDTPCPECGGTLDIWSDGHAPACRHPRRLLAAPPPPIAVWAVLVTTNGRVLWMADTPEHVGKAIAVLDMQGDVLSANAVGIAGPN